MSRNEKISSRQREATSFLCLAVLISAFLYIPINRSSQGGINLTLPFEPNLPLIPIFAIPYLLLLPVFWITFGYSIRRGKDFFRLVNVIIIVFTISNVLYLLIPTYMPRPTDVTGWLHGLVSYIYAHDKPYCDLPSEHASMAAMFALYWWSNSQKYKWLAVGFAASVVLATVFIKQHSIIGALSGVMLGGAVWFLVTKYLSKKPSLK
jgi:membrane-associated phospholipid phosphatase